MGVFVEGVQLHLFLFLLCFLSASCSGIVFGFASLRLLLEADGVYEGSDSEARDKRMMFMYTVGSTLCVSSGWLVGSMTDWLGPVKATCFWSSLVCSGLLLLGLADERSPYWIVVGPIDAYVLGLSLVGIGGLGNLITSLSALYVIPPSMRPFTSAAVNTFFDASSVVWSLVFELYSKLNLSRPVLMCSHAVLCAILAVLLSLMWASGPAEILQRSTQGEEHVEKEDRGSEPTSPAPPSDSNSADASVAMKEPLLRASEDEASQDEEALVQSQLWSFPLAFAVVFICIEGFASNLQLGYVGSLLEEYGDGQRGHLFTQIFGLSLPFALLMVPLIGRFLGTHCISDGYRLIVGLGVFWKVISLIPILPIQVPAFLAFTTFRAILYAANSLFLSKVFKSSMFGTAMGTVSLMMGLATASIFPIVQYATYLDPERPLFLVYSLALTMSSVTWYATWRLKVWMREARRLRLCRRPPAKAPGVVI